MVAPIILTLTHLYDDDDDDDDDKIRFIRNRYKLMILLVSVYKINNKYKTQQQ